MKRRPHKHSLPKAATLPSKQDFDPWNGNLDALSAWKNFGDLDLVQAYQRFCENPGCYQEDFMFMGPKAFKFYFPVVDRYLREVRNPDEFGDSQAWILGKAMHFQMEQDMDVEFLKVIGDLCRYVQTHLGQYAVTPGGRRYVNRPWVQLEKHLARRREAA